MLSRGTLVLLLLIAILAGAGWFGFAKYRELSREEPPPDSEYEQWVPLSYLEATGDIAIITGSYGGFTEDDRFRLITSKNVVTPEGTYAQSHTQIAIFGTDSIVRSAATSTTLDFGALLRVTSGSQVNVLVRGSAKDHPVVNAYIVIIP